MRRCAYQFIGMLITTQNDGRECTILSRAKFSSKADSLEWASFCIMQDSVQSAKGILSIDIVVQVQVCLEK
jgi:hypothetical protein